MTKQTKYRSYNQNELKNICDALCDNIEKVLSALDLHEYTDNGKMITMACPIHGGDNPEGCSIFTDGNTAKGNWNCWTNNCQEDFGRNLFGFVRGVLSNDRATTVSIQETVKFCLQFLGLSSDDLQFIKDVETNNDIKLLDIFDRSPQRTESSIDRATVIENAEKSNAHIVAPQSMVSEGYE